MKVLIINKLIITNKGWKNDFNGNERRMRQKKGRN